MSEIVREMTREELVAYNNELRAENEKLKAELQEARFAAEHNNNLVQEERLGQVLYRKEGEIIGLRFALRCIINGFREKSSLDEVE